MQAALLTEVKQRDAARTSTVHRSQPTALRSAPPTLLGMLHACTEVDRFLGTLVAGLDSYAALSGQLAQQADFAVELGDDVQLFSLNALLAASRLGVTRPHRWVPCRH